MFSCRVSIPLGRFQGGRAGDEGEERGVVSIPLGRFQGHEDRRIIVLSHVFPFH